MKLDTLWLTGRCWAEVLGGRMISSERGKLLEGGGRLLEGFGKVSPHCPCDQRPAKNLLVSMNGIPQVG